MSALSEQRSIVDGLLDGIENALTHVANPATGANGNGNKSDDELGSLVNELRSQTLRVGVTNRQLERLVYFVTHEDYNLNKTVTTRAALMRCCVPSEAVPVREIENLFGAFGSVHATLQSQIARFIACVPDLVDDANALRRLYAVMFHWLDYAELRPYLAHVLYRVTLREHCVPHRVRRLTALLKRNANDRALRALAAVYQCFAPLEIGLSGTVSADAGAFAGAHAVDLAAWRAEIALARSRAGMPDTPPIGLPLRPLGAVSAGAHQAHGARPSSASVTIDDVDTAETFVDSLERLQLPDRMSAILSNEWLQHYVALAPTESALMRVQQWLAFTLDDHARWRGSANGRGSTEALFAALAQLTQFVGETLPVVERFLSEYLRSVSGDASFGTNSDTTLFSILAMVECVHPMPFEQLHARLLAPLQTLFYSGGAAVKARILACLRRLCVNWAGVEWASVRQQALKAPDIGAADARLPTARYAIGGVALRMDHYGALHALIRFNERLCVLALQAHHHHALLQHQSLATFEFAAQLHRQHGVPFFCMPPPVLVSSALFSSNASALSRVCQLFVELANEVTAIRSDSATSNALRVGSVVSSGAEHKERINEYLFDIASVLWNKGLFVDDKSRKGPGARELRATFGMSAESIAALRARFGSELSDSFAVARHPALAAFAAEYARSIGAVHGTPGASSLKRRIGDDPMALVHEQRKQFVVWLSQNQQLSGVEQFLSNFTARFKEGK